MADTYYSKQYAKKEQLVFDDNKKMTLSEYLGIYDDSQTDYQQWIAKLPNSDSFEKDQPYIVKLEICQNQNYKLDYGLRLVTTPSGDTRKDWRQETNYELIKYITIPAVNLQKVGQSTVWLYRIDDNDNENVSNIPINAAVAIEIIHEDSSSENPSEDNSTSNSPSYTAEIINAAIDKIWSSSEDISSHRASKFFYCTDSQNTIIHIWKCNERGNLILKDDNPDSDPKDYINILQYNSNLMLHNFDSEISENSIICYFIFTPITSNQWNAIYFYLRPIEEDEEIRWTQDQHTFRGRHTTIKNVWYAPLTNCIDIDTTKNEVVNIGVWGRPKQLMAINGQGIEIGPSGYFELKDFTINSLCIANTEATDKYVVDIQYKNIIE